ncbi:serine hydrolase domain-containing protein [Sphingosinicella rhizophila]|uniref:Serine hydrolase domain-containing protein n=1 Tax=Sphingosinicella rhizophila TaxID=3050082 RepID=A0ABU3Q632_9SPHN|nr:serine hydrolase domain-containing protein [Sphingosinicella sp. GR2756]MDT9598867.1 serine hydrolase domain-containing protein [Sphingosinicella sp. GR2756]
MQKWAIMTLLLGLIATGKLVAAPPPAPAFVTGDSAADAPQLVAEDLEPWLDAMVPAALERTDIAGGAIVIVKDGRILFQKGYGYSDVARRKPVDPGETMFRPGSVAKTFTWTAVMQLVEKGRIDLDADVNAYLDFRIPRHGGNAVTMRMLMHHSAGFEEAVKGMMAQDAASLKPLGLHLKQSVPAQIYPPGRISAYSNYSTALAGYIVERVSGEPFDLYMERHIFAPLGMRRSTFRIPPPPALAPFVSKGYLTASQAPGPFELDQLGPAGSISATVGDMGRFMIGHLEQGNGLMRPDTARSMHFGRDRPIPALNGFSYGFFEYNRNGRRIIGHGGDSQYFFNELRMFPNERVGFFIALNSAGKNGGAYPVMEGIFDHFLNRYFPAPEAPLERTVPTAAAHAALIAGRYESSRHIESSFMSLVYAIAQQVDVAANEDGTISVTGGGGFYGADGAAKKWREIGPFVWREAGGDDLLAARIENGRVVAFGTNSGGPTALWLPVPLHRSGALNLPLLGAAFTILLIATLAWPIAPILRRQFERPASHKGKEAKLHSLSRVGALLGVVFTLGWAWIFIAAMNDLSLLNATLDPWIRLLQLVGVSAGLCTVATIYLAWLTWTKDRGWFTRIGNSLLAAAQLAILWIAFAFHFITPSLRF